MFHYPGVPQLYPFVNNSINKSWYALRITYSRELAFKEYLDSRGVRNFLPMRYEYVFRGERKIRKLVPVVHNLVFVYATRSEVDEMKSTVGASLPIRYIMDRETRQPITIPEVQMRSFIAVAGNYDEQVVYLDPSVVSMKGETVSVSPVASSRELRGSLSVSKVTAVWWFPSRGLWQLPRPSFIPL